MIESATAGSDPSEESTGNTVVANRVFGNDGVPDSVGIPFDLGNDGADENDLFDDDTGPNARQNHPTATVHLVSDGFRLSGEMESDGSSQFQIDIYLNVDGRSNWIDSFLVEPDFDPQFSKRYDFTWPAGASVSLTATNLGNVEHFGILSGHLPRPHEQVVRLRRSCVCNELGR